MDSTSVDNISLDGNEGKIMSAEEVQQATKTTIVSYINERITEYEKYNLTGCDLFDYWKTDFENFDSVAYKKTTEGTRNLRDFLRQKGVFIPKNRKSIADNLIASSKVWMQWPIDTSHEHFNQVSTVSIPSTDQPSSSASVKTAIHKEKAENQYLKSELQTRSSFDTEKSPSRYTQNNLITLSKIYTEDLKYSGEDDSFDYKYGIFIDLCEKAEIPKNIYFKAFSSMLRGAALKHFYTSIKTNTHITNLSEACENMRETFEGEEYKRSMLTKWNNISLRTVITKNPGKDIEFCLQNLVEELRIIQLSLGNNLQDDTFLQNKIITACQAHPACTIGCSIPASSSVALINNLRQSISNHLAINSSSDQNQFNTNSENNLDIDDNDNNQYFIDRKYHSNQQNKSFKGPHQKRNGHFKKCFVCKRQGCWSTRHSDAEKEKARDVFKEKFGKVAEPRYGQFLTEYEGNEPINISDDIEAMIVSMDDVDITDDECFITDTGKIGAAEAFAMITKLYDRSASHALIKEIDDIEYKNSQSSENGTLFLMENRYGPDEFHGIIIDTGAAGKSTAGYNQYLAYKIAFNETPIDTTNKGAVNATFGIGSSSSIGSINIDTPIGECIFHVVTANTPFLLSLNDMDAKGIILDNVHNKLINKNGHCVPIVRRFGHPFLMWGPMIAHQCYLTETELRTLHRRFGHPSALKLVHLLEKAGHDEHQNRQILEKIGKNCDKCQKHANAPMRFKFTLRDDVDFNHSIYIDIMYISGSPLLHVVDEATRFQAAKWLRNMSSQHVWNVLRMCWIDVYLGPPDIINHDAGSNFTSQEFKDYSKSLNIKLKEAPVESAQTMSIVERYHKPLRRAFEIIKEEINADNTEFSKAMVLQMAVKAVNDTAGYDGIVPTLLVFGALPRLTEMDPPAPSVVKRAAAIKKAMEEVSKLRAKRQVAGALRTRNGPITEDLPIGSDVLVWRTHEKSWNGPYKLAAVKGETGTIILPHGPTDFRMTSIKRYDSPIHPTNNNMHIENTEQKNNDTAYRTLPRRNAGLPARYKNDILVKEDPTPNFANSRLTELNGLLERGVFEFIEFDDIPSHAHIFKSRFVDRLKNEGTANAFEKSRLVVQAFNDNGKKNILTQSPTIQRVSQRLLLCLALYKNFEIFTRDISQAYTQSKNKIMRDIFIHPPIELNLPSNIFLKILLPLYGIPEAGTYWFHTYHDHHTRNLNLQPSSYDFCLLFNPEAIVGLQTDDTLIACNPAFLIKEEIELKRAEFLAKPLEKLTDKNSITFNGAQITLSGTKLLVSQKDQLRKIKLLKNINPEEYISQRARGAYVSTVCQPQVAFGLSFAAQTTSPTLTDVENLNLSLKWQIENSSKGLTFVKLRNKLRLIVFTDSSFANNADFSSQIGYVILLADEFDNCNVIHWSSVKCKRITRSVIASELYAMNHGFDTACVIKHSLDKILREKVPLIICIDSRSLYECLVKLGTTREKRLMIDIMAIRQAYERREIAEVIWITGESNPADALTKFKGNNSLEQIIDTNKLNFKAAAWVERKQDNEDGNSYLNSCRS